MLDAAKTLKGYKLSSRDGEIGMVDEFYFDDHFWTIRYLIANTGNWLMGRQVLLSPHALSAVNRAERNIEIDLTKKQIEDSPNSSTDQPVSRQFEDNYHMYYGWPGYWGGLSMWGAYPYIVRTGDFDPKSVLQSAQRERDWDYHLRSTNDVSGHAIHAIDGAIGHVTDFLIDDETWAIRYLVADTRNWWPGKKVLVSPQWIERVSWSEAAVFVNLSRDTIRLSPEYLEDAPLNRDYEIGLHGHYNRQGYWADETAAAESKR